MSWIKEAFDGINNSKDPFIKVVFRLTFLVLFILLCFLTFSIITGKKIVFTNGIIQIVDVASKKDFTSTGKEITAISKQKPPFNSNDPKKPPSVYPQIRIQIHKIPIIDGEWVDTIKFGGSQKWHIRQNGDQIQIKIEPGDGRGHGTFKHELNKFIIDYSQSGTDERTSQLCVSYFEIVLWIKNKSRIHCATNVLGNQNPCSQHRNTNISYDLVSLKKK